MSWKSGEQNEAGQGVLIVESPARLRLEVQDPAGGVHALLIINGPRFFWFSASDPTNWVGPITGLKKLRQIPVSGEVLARALAGHFAPSDSGFVSENFAGDLESWTAENPDKGSRVTVGYEDYAARFGVSVPQVVKIELFEHDEFKSRFTWRWNDLRLEGAVTPDLLEIPSGTVFGKKTRQLK